MKTLDYVFGGVYLLYFGICLVIFHPIQVIALNIFGSKAHQKVVNTLNFFLTKGLFLNGSSSKVVFKSSLPANRPIIFVANHQSMFDIPPIIWYLRKYTPLFVSKIELGKGIPSISYNLRKGGAALINRKDGKSAILEISKLAKHIDKNNFSAVIFPEGTRSRNQKVKPFSIGGVGTLIKKCPNALVVPVAINGSGKFNPKGVYPLSCFTSMSWTVLPPIEPQGLKLEELVLKAENQIKEELGQA